MEKLILKVFSFMGCLVIRLELYSSMSATAHLATLKIIHSRNTSEIKYIHDASNERVNLEILK